MRSPNLETPFGLLQQGNEKPQRTAKSRIMVSMGNFDAKQLLKDKKFWFASFLIAWAAALQGHMMWLQKQDSFRKKFSTGNDNEEEALPK